MATYNNIKRIKVGDNVFNLYDSGGTITRITTSAGTHSAVDKTSGAVSFNVPTKTSHLTNDSGFLTSHQSLANYATKSYVDDKVATALTYKGTIGDSSSGATVTSLPTTYKVGDCYKVITAGTYAGNVCQVGDLIVAVVARSGSGNVDADWTVVQANIQTSTGSATPSMSTTATKTTLGTAFTIPNVINVGSASTWTFESKSIPNVTSAGSASTWAFEDIACDDITSWSAGSGSASISGAIDSSDSTQLNITISHTHIAPSLSYTARTVSSKKSGGNGSAPTLGTAITVYSKSGGGNGSAPTLGTAFTVPNVTGNTTGAVSGGAHTHTIG